jgi:hypothetical protein
MPGGGLQAHTTCACYKPVLVLTAMPGLPLQVEEMWLAAALRKKQC